jgi:predicted nuclease of predicted toxin-antitoxin system
VTLLWLDVQLPPTLARWLREHFEFEVVALGHTRFRTATDTTILRAAIAAGAIILTKDQDFAWLSKARQEAAPVIWLRCGNVSNVRLRGILSATLHEAVIQIANGEVLVEVRGP